MTATKTEPPVCSYPVKDYWRVYTLTLGADRKACGGDCDSCNHTKTLSSVTLGGRAKALLPEAVRGTISAESRDWLLSCSAVMRRSVWQVLAGCECDPEFVSGKISEAHAANDASDGPRMTHWTVFHGLCRNVHMDKATQLRFAHDVLFSNRKVLTDVGARLRELGNWYGVRDEDMPCRALQQRDSLGIRDGVRWGALNHPDVLDAVLSPDGSGFGAGLSDEVRTCAEVLEPFDRLLEGWSPDLPQRLPLGFRSALMHSNCVEADTFLNLLLTGDLLGPIPAQALQGVLDLVHAAGAQRRCRAPSEPRTRLMQQKLDDTMKAVGLLPSAPECTLRRLKLKLALRKGEFGLATERLVVASKSWGKVALRDRKKWLEIPVTADPSWTRQEPLHA